MSLNWRWENKCGEIILEQKTASGDWKQFPLALYQGNAFLIMLSENDEDDTYQMYSFFADKEHAKNCLGLKKGTDNIFCSENTRWAKIRLNKSKYSYAKDLAAMVAQAFDNITIEIYSEP